MTPQSLRKLGRAAVRIQAMKRWSVLRGDAGSVRPPRTSGRLLKLAGCPVPLNLSFSSVSHAMPEVLIGSTAPAIVICTAFLGVAGRGDVYIMGKPRHATLCHASTRLAGSVQAEAMPGYRWVAFLDTCNTWETFLSAAL